MKDLLETPTLSHLSLDDYTKIYEPAEDSFLLIDALQQDFYLIQKLKPLVCVEVGSGSGVVITALGKALGSSSLYFATDINPMACHKTKETGCYNNVDIGIVRTNLVDGIYCDGNVDILIFNPPYVVTPSEEVYEATMDSYLTQSWAGGIKGREVMDRLFPAVPNLLSAHGVFYLLVTLENAPFEIGKIMEEFGFVMTIVKERKIRGEHLFVLRFERAR